MKIDRVRIVPFAIPYTQGGVTTSLGEDPLMRNVLVELRTDEGIAGWGETAPLPAYGGETQETIVTVLRENLAPYLLGRDPRDVKSLILQMDRILWGQPFAKSAIDFALHDLVARVLGTPLHQLFGGAVRSELPLAWTIGWKPPSEAAQEAMDAADRGFRAIKLKIGSPDISEDLVRVRYVRERLPQSVRLRVDANQGYSLANAKRVLLGLKDLEIQLLEQPIPRWDLEGMRQLREHSLIPLLADEAVFDAHDVVAVATHRSADAVNIKPQKLGGFLKSMRCVEVAGAFGLDVFPSSRICTSVGIAACTHFYAALERIDYEGEFADGLLVSDMDVCVQRVPTRDGMVEVPVGVGSGVEVDEGRLARVALGTFVK